MKLDGIVTVVDAKHIRRQLQGQGSSAQHGAHDGAVPDQTSAEEALAGPSGAAAHANGNAPPAAPKQARGTSLPGPALEAQRQVAYADTILLNKVDLVTEAELADIERTIHRHNAAVQVRLPRPAARAGEIACAWLPEIA